MIKFEYDEGAESEETRPPISYTQSGGQEVSPEEAQAVAMLEIAWTMRDILKRLEAIENEIAVGGSRH